MQKIHNLPVNYADWKYILFSVTDDGENWYYGADNVLKNALNVAHDNGVCLIESINVERA